MVKHLVFIDSSTFEDSIDRFLEKWKRPEGTGCLVVTREQRPSNGSNSNYMNSVLGVMFV